MKILKDDAAIAAYYGKYYLQEHNNYFSETRSKQEVTQLIKWFGDKPDSVCDVACGDGHHLLTFAQIGVTKGFGFDISKELVKIAQQNLATYNYQVEVASFASWKPEAETFNITYSLFSSIGYCLEDKDASALIEKMASTTKTGGLVCIDADNVERLKRYLDNPENTDANNGYLLDEQTRILLTRECRGNEILETKTRFYAPNELTSFFKQAGLTNITLYGGFDESPFSKDNSRLIITGRR
jgi:ubiquinone/menaquinone biosynthesis C-methylase UbiE